MKAILKRSYLEFTMRQAIDTVLVFDYLPNTTVTALVKRYSRHGFTFHRDREEGVWDHGEQRFWKLTYAAPFATQAARADHEKWCSGQSPHARYWVGVSFDPAAVLFPIPPARPSRPAAEPRVGVLVRLTVDELARLDAARKTTNGRLEGCGPALLRLAGLVAQGGRPNPINPLNSPASALPETSEPT